MSRRQIVIIVLILIIVGVSAFLLYQFRDSIFGQRPTQSKSVFPLKFGSTGPEVRKLQQWLIQNGFPLPQHGVDGEWGNETQQAVISAFNTTQITEQQYKQLGL